jgi:hypothetical protein
MGKQATAAASIAPQWDMIRAFYWLGLASPKKNPI